MSFDPDTLYALLPQVRSRDSSGALKALVRVLAEQAEVLEDLARSTTTTSSRPAKSGRALHRRAGGHPRPVGDPEEAARHRNEVANTLALRRRKGTAAALEQLAEDVTDLDAVVVEYFRHLATTQYLKHLRPTNQAFASLRRHAVLEAVGTPFDTLAQNADVRPIARGRGRHNIPNLGIFLWPLAAQPVTRAAAFKVDDFRYCFDPLGAHPARHPARAGGHRQPGRPAQRAAADRPAALAEHLADYGVGLSILLRVDSRDWLPALDAHGLPLAPLASLVRVCDLSDLTDGSGSVTGWAHCPVSGAVAIDPVLGRIAFPSGEPAPSSVEVSCQRAFGLAMGGGEYPRAAAPGEPIRVPAGASLQAPQRRRRHRRRGRAERQRLLPAASLAVHVAAGQALTLRAAPGRRPVLVLGGELVVHGGEASAFALEGLLVAGGALHAPRNDPVDGNANRLHSLALRHCTLVPGATPAMAGIPAQAARARLVADVPGLELRSSTASAAPCRPTMNAAWRASAAASWTPSPPPGWPSAGSAAGPAHRYTSKPAPSSAGEHRRDAPRFQHPVPRRRAGPGAAPVQAARTDTGRALLPPAAGHGAAAALPLPAGHRRRRAAGQAGVHVPCLRRRRLRPARPTHRPRSARGPTTAAKSAPSTPCTCPSASPPCGHASTNSCASA
jgi:hypothetical protein